ncbi:MAG TPA: LL-diaminopimelate aminotransferase [Elusimicrobia bacterium]|nr:MAG: LL-diaminopimelate aminotransferase [Elusimicrobia bacterium RIFOXYA12_FULL_49_49]OGS09225.1 MAG: LL-diaminopimelate aminotransferase [Elusimicrobia bacterium RIFOXYA1_FULL_47_7]OGS16204.1 MAG: LL-diaminopimelate aminotransferase [Elusimicrobia bacterium RIFOXYA2_FULL_47_53]OGS26597.1 MAG: LL-diaminopimelate aminotransferase [Elusimicrobia bacterium RIFOXYB12_FULL_50_12]OGS31358.1 MAG: LL-diaminopimelate aminotransferase [Elusimicrobia bacterium RIFOXYB2_FULL_46_23]HBU69539.1 LL-diamin
MKVNYSEKLKKLPPYLFVEIDRKKKAAMERGVDIIALGVGDPDQPTPEHIVKAGQEALKKGSNHQYPFGTGMKVFREAVAKWYKSRFSVDLNPDTEICSLIGSKEGIGHFHLGFVNPGDVVLIPEPGYPVYNTGTIFTDGEPYFMPLKEENNFLPRLDLIPEAVAKRARIMFVNYPNNPTAAIADRNFYAQVIEFAKKYNIIVAHDAAYSEIYYEKKPVSFLELPGARDVGVEFHSLSKTYNMTGWRLGWACGNADVIKGLATVKDNYDSGVFQAVQEAGVAALNGPQDCVEKMRGLYRERRDALCDGLNSLGWKVRKPEATFYVWARVPSGYTSSQTVGKLLDEAGIVCTPGNGLGASGEGYVRFALTVDVPRIKEALARVSKIKW